MAKICRGFGNREVFQNIDNELKECIEIAINMGCTTFYTGGMGDFDLKFASAVKRAKQTFNDIKLICVKPYLTKELNDNKDYYYSLYDDIFIPTELADIYYKAIITRRNKWIVDNSDIIIAYTIRGYGGAYNAIKYAERQNKLIIKISQKLPPI